LIEHVIPALLNFDQENMLDKATICQNGDITTHFEYLRAYVNGS
jgi:hypothetical protein